MEKPEPCPDAGSHWEYISSRCLIPRRIHGTPVVLFNKRRVWRRMVCWVARDPGSNHAPEAQEQTTVRGKDMLSRNRKGLAAWQARWLTLHDELHLLEVLLSAITPTAEYTSDYWALSSEIITLGEDLRDAYAQQLAVHSEDPTDTAFLGLRRRLTTLQAHAQTLTLENEVG